MRQVVLQALWLQMPLDALVGDSLAAAAVQFDRAVMPARWPRPAAVLHFALTHEKSLLSDP